MQKVTRNFCAKNRTYEDINSYFVTRNSLISISLQETASLILKT